MSLMFSDEYLARLDDRIVFFLTEKALTQRTLKLCQNILMRFILIKLQQVMGANIFQFEN